MSLSRLDEIKTRINAFRLGELQRQNEWAGGPGEDMDWLVAEVEKWKDEYENLCKFSTQFEEQRDDSRAEIASLKELLRVKDEASKRSYDAWVTNPERCRGEE